MGLVIGLLWGICAALCIWKADKKYSTDKKKATVLIVFFSVFSVCGIAGHFTGSEALVMASVMLSSSILCMGLLVYAWYQVLGCKTSVPAVYLRYNTYSGGKGTRSYAPVFRYRYMGQEYERQTYESYSLRKINKLFQPGEEYRIFINEESPENCVSKRKVSFSYYIIFCLGVVFLLMYVIMIFDI